MSGILERSALGNIKKKDKKSIFKDELTNHEEELANHEEDGWIVYEVKSPTVLDPTDQSLVQDVCALQDSLEEADNEHAQSVLDNAGIPKRTEDTSENKSGEEAGNKKVACTTDKEENGYDDFARALASTEPRDNNKIDVLEVDSSCNAVEPTPAIEDTKGNESNETKLAKNYQGQDQTGVEPGADTKPVADSQTRKKDANREEEKSTEDVHQNTSRKSDQEKSTEDVHQNTARESEQEPGVPIAPDAIGDHTGEVESLVHANSQADNEASHNGEAQHSSVASEKQPRNSKDATTSPTHPPTDLSSENQPAQSEPNNISIDPECPSSRDAAGHDSSCNRIHVQCADQQQFQLLQAEYETLKHSMEHLQKQVYQLTEDKLASGKSEDCCLSAPGTSHRAHDMSRGASPQACLPEASTDSLPNCSRARSPRPQEGLVWIIPEVMYKDDRLTTPLRQLADRVNKQLEIRSLPSSSITIEHVGKVILPVIAASRVGSDMNAAVQKAKLKVPAVVLIYNHLAPHMSTIRTATKDRLSDRKLVDSCQDMVDVVFWNGNVYDCDANSTAVRHLKKVWANKNIK